MEHTSGCILNEEEIKIAINYWLHNSGYIIRAHPGHGLDMVEIIRKMPPGGSSEPMIISALCTFKTKE